MEERWERPGGAGAHRPLTRVVYGPRVALGPLTDPSVRLAPLFDSPRTTHSDTTRTTHLDAPRTTHSAVAPATLVELQDSCYSSCSESDASHSSLSRNASAASETLAQETAPSLLSADVPPGPLSVWTEWGGWEESDEFRKLSDFATKLGFSETQLCYVLSKLAQFPPNQDQVLAELTKLGRDSPPCKTNSASPASSTHPAATLPSPQTLSLLRSIVIDGSNLAYAHGQNDIFSCAGLSAAVEWFRLRGHSDIKVFLPQFRRETPRPDSPPVADPHILAQLDQEGCIVWTPSRRVNGRRIVCHDDRYILKTAIDKDAVIVSNDHYRDLARESPDFRRVVADRLLMFSFVDGRFMPPDDPMGRSGPSLDAFLRKGGSSASATAAAPLCPYARKCTYGNKCKFYHPERPNGVHVSVTDRLRDRSARQRSALSPAPSLGLPNSAAPKLPAFRTLSLNPAALPVTPTTTTTAVPTTTLLQHPSIVRNLSNPAPPPLLSSPAHLAPPDHPALQRNRSAPGPSHPLLQPPSLAPPQPSRKDSASDSQIPRLTSSNHLFTPSSAVWGHSELSVSPVWPRQDGDGDREKLAYHLSQLFSPKLVRAVMDEQPNLRDPQQLCARILQRSHRHH